MSDDEFDALYGALDGDYADNKNMGMILGPCSRHRFMLDLDTYKSAAAVTWWQGVLAVHNNKQELETWEQFTGGGGRQLFFECPEGYAPQNATTDLDIDVRGPGGFAVLPPSLHASNRQYAWRPGHEPWEMDILVAPAWLCEEIDRLIKVHGGGKGPTAPRTNGNGHGQDPEYTGFVRLTNGRERHMRNLQFAAMTGYCNQGIVPGEPEMLVEWAAYERHCGPKVIVAGEDNAAGLEREKRGFTAFKEKWDYTLSRWAEEVVPAAAERRAREPQPEPPPIDPITGKPLPIFLSSAQFVAGFVPPDYLVDGIVQCGFLYSLTARTNHGKTSVCMYVAQSVARSAAMHYREVKGGTVLFFAGENPDDIRMRFLTLADVYGFDPDKIKIRFKPGIINIHEMFDQISAEADTIDDLVLVIVDTAAAYFTGDDTNNNNQQGVFARQLRRLTTLRGKPAVIVNCHPIKNAARDNLLPMGGSAFVNEVDGNLTLWANGEKQTSLHWLGKFRGPEFDPVSFDLVTASTERVKDAKGRLIPSVVAKPISEITLEASEVVQEQEENRLLTAMHDDPRASFTALANRCGFVIDGRPLKTKVSRLVQRLAEDKMLSKHRGGKYRLTQKGRREIGVESENDDD
jgi:hypothetical protein